MLALRPETSKITVNLCTQHILQLEFAFISKTLKESYKIEGVENK